VCLSSPCNNPHVQFWRFLILCSVLRCVECVAVWCSALQCVWMPGVMTLIYSTFGVSLSPVVCWSCCSVVQSSHQKRPIHIKRDTSIWKESCEERPLHTHCNKLKHTATHCKTLQHTATHCNTLQHTATHCNTLHTRTQLSSHMDVSLLMWIGFFSCEDCTTLQHASTLCSTKEQTYYKDLMQKETYSY